MEYEIVITKRQKNPEYSPCRDPYDRRPEQDPYLFSQDLRTVLTEEEFKAVKKACLEVM